jgi:hypothetical protein
VLIGSNAAKKGFSRRKISKRTACVSNITVRFVLSMTLLNIFSLRKSYLELGAGGRHAIVSGHDIERWVLKTDKAAAVSKNLARGREPLSGAFSRDEAILEMLDSPRQWQDGAGLYCVMWTT